MEQELTMQQLDGQVFRGQLDPGMKDFVIRKKDGFPAYQLTSITDDLHFGVDLIVRGQDLWPSTLAQLYLARLLPGGTAFANATFHHHGLLTEKDGDKLSKSEGATSIQFLRKEGASAADIYKMIGLCEK
jgi:glutamyl-tRNA synthetase